MPTVADLGKAVKAKYPGAYDDMDDAALGAKIKGKYSQYNDYEDIDARGLPPGQTAPPGVPSLALPKELQSTPEGKDMLEKLENGIHDGSFPGPNMVVNGIKQLVRSVPAFSNSPTRGAADVIEGAGKTLSPVGIAAGVTAPVTGALALGGGALGQLLGGAAAKGVGIGPDGQRLAGDIGGIAGGAGGAQIAPDNPLVALQNAGAALKGGAKGVLKGASETLKIGPTGIKVSPLEALKQGYSSGKGAIADLNTQRLIQQSRNTPRLPGWMTQQPEAPPAGAPAPAPSIAPTQLPSGRQVGGIQNQPVPPPPPIPKVSVINGKAFLRNEKGQFYKGAEMPAPQGSTDKIVVVGGKPYLNINGHLFDPKALQK